MKLEDKDYNVILATLPIWLTINAKAVWQRKWSSEMEPV